MAPSEYAWLLLTGLDTASSSSWQATYLMPQSEALRPEFVLVNLTIETGHLGSWRKPTGSGSTRGVFLISLCLSEREFRDLLTL